jgi:deazaflavin-dependent oxidoreductase (nitroreductase family)
LAAEPLTARSSSDQPPLGAGGVGAGGLARGTDRVEALDETFADDDRFARLTIAGRRSGEPRTVTVGFVDEPDGSILVAAGTLDRSWASNLVANPAVVVTAGGRTFSGVAEELEDRDPRRGRAVRGLILRYGTPSEHLGSGPIFAIRPADAS